MYTIDQIQSAILTWVKASGLAAVCKTMDHYAGQIDDLIAEVAALTINYPACFVMYQGSGFTAEGSDNYLDAQTFSLLLVAKDLRGGNDLQASMYSMIEAAKAIRDQTFGLDIAPLTLIRAQAIKVTKTFSIYRVDVKTMFEMS
jgi:phage gp37-like protein